MIVSPIRTVTKLFAPHPPISLHRNELNQPRTLHSEGICPFQGGTLLRERSCAGATVLEMVRFLPNLEPQVVRLIPYQPRQWHRPWFRVATVAINVPVSSCQVAVTHGQMSPDT